MARLYYLFSSSDALLYFDPELGQVCHGLFDQSPKNLALQIQGRKGRLLVAGGKSAFITQLHFFDDNDTLLTQPCISSWNLEIDAIEKRLIAIRLNERFFTAEPYNKIIQRNRNLCNLWESFRIEEIEAIQLNAMAPSERSDPSAGEPETSVVQWSRADISVTVAGFFFGHWSLVAVNRQLAVCLEAELPGCARIIASEYRIDDFSGNEAQLRKLSQRASPRERFSVLIHHRFPVTFPAPRADLTLAFFFWEESKVAPEIIQSLNRYDGVLTSANFIEKALIGSGLKRPVFTVGYSPDLEKFKALNEKRTREPGEKFTFLHVSSCYPIKGVDVLLQAFIRSFRSSDPVRLIVKGYPNEYNQVSKLLDQLRSEDEKCPEIVFINSVLAESQILELYLEADAMVLPTRGEGFNIPAAEAVASGLSLIVTGYGGHMDYLALGCARTLKYKLVASGFRVTDGSSLWAEPDLADLCSALKEAFEGKIETSTAARDEMLEHLAPAAWINRIQHALAELRAVYSL